MKSVTWLIFRLEESVKKQRRRSERKGGGGGGAAGAGVPRKPDLNVSSALTCASHAGTRIAADVLSSSSSKLAV